MKSSYAVVTARSPRVAVLLPDTDGPDAPGADADLDRVLEWFGRVWGGAYMICLPSRTSGVAPIFRRLAAVYDPDLMLPWQPTLGSVALADLDAAKALVARAKGPAGSGRSVTFAELDGDDAMLVSTIPVGGRADPTDLLSELSTFESVSPPRANHLQSEFPPPLTYLASLGQAPALDLSRRPLTPVTAAAAYRETIGRPAADLELTNLDPWRRRLLKARVGVAGGDTPGRRLPGERQTLYSVDPAADAQAAASVGLTGAYTGPDAPAWTDPSVLASTPLARSRTGLQVWTHDNAMPRQFLVVVGDSIEDFCLYLCWLRLYGDGAAAWLPAAAVPHAQLDDPSDAESWEAVIELVREMMLDLPGHIYTGGSITSFTIHPDRLGLLQSALAATHWHYDVPARFRAMPVVAPDDLRAPEAPAYFVATGDVFERGLPLVIHDDGTAGAVVRSPVPLLLSDSAKSGVDALLGNWVADVTVARCRLPPRANAVRAAELDTSLIEAGLVRVGRTGTAAVAVAYPDLPGELLVDHALTGLSLRDPDLGALLGHLLPDGTTWQLSAAGRFYQGFADLAGGLASLVDMLRDPATCAIFAGFLDTAKHTSEGSGPTPAAICAASTAES